MPTPNFNLRLGLPSLTTRGLQDIHDSINALPRFSTFSFSTPESNVTQQAPAFGMNESSAGSRVWAKINGSGNTGWVALA